MKALRIERLGSREEFHFALHGSVDEAGARALDRVLFECQARGAREVTLDFTSVTLVSTLGTAVLARQGRVYEGTERRIVAKGLAPQVRAVLGEVEAILYGLLIIGFLLFEPKGLFGIWIRVRNYWKAWPFSY